MDDHPMMREGLAAVINRQHDLVVIAEAASSAEAMSALENATPDVMVTDLTMPGRSGLEFLKDVHAMLPELPILVLSMHDETIFAERVLRSGARGYLMKDAGAEKTLEAIRVILGGQPYASPQISMRLLDSLSPGKDPRGESSPIACLSDREFEVFQRIGSGKSTKDVADELHLSPKTVEAHRANIKQKLKIPDALSLVHHAVRWVESQNNLPHS